jgi:hypothetical protein
MIALKNSSMYRKKLLIIVCMLCFLTYSFAQEKTVDEILTESQNTMQNFQNMSFDMNYNWYETYTTEKPSISYLGSLIKFEKTTYSKINKTFFITDSKLNMAIKCNETEKAFIVTSNTEASENQSPLELLNMFIKQFKVKEVKDHGDQWICTLTTDVITQLPYGKVEIYINKETALVEKQVLYFLSRVPYTDEKGEKKVGNPRMEITLSNYKTKLSEDEKIITKIASYINKNGKEIVPTTAYKEFKISQY